MSDLTSTHPDVLAELQALRRRVAELEIARAERTHADRRLQDHVRLLDVLLDTIPNPVFYKDTAGRYLGCNRAFAERFLGRPKEAIIGHTLFDFSDTIPRSLAEFFREQDERLFDEPGVQAHESRVRFVNGLQRDVVFHKATFENAEGEVAGLVGVMLDVTEQRAAEREIRHLRDQLNELRARDATA